METNKKLAAVVNTVLAAAVLLTLFVVTQDAEPGWTTWLATLPAWVILAVTAAARVHDITQYGKRWFARRLGMVMVAASAAALILAPIMGYSNSFPTWRSCGIYWGFALSWLTTPHMPPWWKYISGEWRTQDNASVLP